MSTQTSQPGDLIGADKMASGGVGKRAGPGTNGGKAASGIPIPPPPPEPNDSTQPSAAVPPAPGSGSGPVTQPLLHVVDTPDVKQVRDKLGLTLDDFAALLSSSSRSVSGWENGQSMSPLAERVFREVKALIDRLAALADPARFSDWLKQPNPTFGGVSPIQLIKSGQMYRLWELVFRLESGDPL